jgi:hypothetical protein
VPSPRRQFVGQPSDREVDSVTTVLTSKTCSPGGFSEAGYPGAIRRVGDRLAVAVNGVYVAPIDVYIAYLYAGQKDLALEWLLKSVEARDPNVSGAVRDPFASDSFRDDPRFQNLLRRTRLPI